MTPPLRKHFPTGHRIPGLDRSLEFSPASPASISLCAPGDVSPESDIPAGQVSDGIALAPRNGPIRRVRQATLLAICLAVLLALNHFTAATVAGQGPPPRDHYDIRADLNVESTYLTAVETVDFTNVTSDTLLTIVFNVPAAYFGGFSISDATINGVPVRGLIEKQSIEFPLPRELAPGATATIVLHFRLDIPPGDGRYGAAMGVIALADWYPVLAVYRDGWQRVPYSDIGDPFYAEAADYDVFLATSSPVVIVASGDHISQIGRSWHFTARSARDFALAASARYQLLQGSVGGVSVTVATLPEHAASASRMLSVTVEAMARYAEQVGPYPYRTFRIAETVAQHNVHTAQEHSGLILLRSDIVEGNGLLLEMLTAHEIAHQWFFGVVGSDQTREPWLDEGLVNGMALDYFRQKDFETYKALWEGWGDYTTPGYLNRGIYGFKSGSVYFDEVYRRGATFVRDLQDFIGPAAYRQGLQNYYAANRFAVADSADFLLRMRLASSRDPMPLFQRAFDYPYLWRPDPVISLTVPSPIVAGQNATIAVHSDNPAARLAASIDTVTVTIGSDGTVKVPAALEIGEHTLTVLALGPQVGYARKDVVFAVAPPEPTPTPAPTPVATRPAPTPVPLPPAPPRTLVDREVFLIFLGWLGMSAVFGIGAAALRESD